MNDKVCYLILGMHRSGTSVLSRVLCEMGVSFGDQLKSAAFDNQEGFYEDKRLVRLNDEILRRLGQTWHSTVAMPENWINFHAIQEIYPEILTFLKEFTKKESPFALKDPRLSLTLPLWEKALRELGIKVTTLLIIRHPQAVIQSLAKRNFMTVERAGVLWLKYNAMAEQSTRHITRHFILHKAFLEQPFSTIQALDIFKEDRYVDLKNIVKQVIKPQLVHHHALQKSKFDPFLLKYYDELVGLTKGKAVSLKTIYESDEFKNRVIEPSFFALLSWDFGEGYGQMAPQKKAIQIGQQTLDFLIEIPKNKVVKSLKLQPTNILAAVVYKLVKIFDSKKEKVKIQRIVKKSILNHSNEFIFDENTFIELYVEKGIKEKLYFQVALEYLNFGQNAHENIHQIGQKLSASNGQPINRNLPPFSSPIGKTQFWWSFLGTAIRSPFQILKHLNSHNFRKLKRAIANESPQQILSNFKQFLQEGKSKNVLDVDMESPTNIPIEKTKLLTEKNKETVLGKLLFVFQDLPDYNQSSGGKRAFKLLKILRKWFEIKVVSLGERQMTYQKALGRNGIEVIENLSVRKIKKQHPTFHAIIFGTYKMYREFSKITPLYPNTKIIIDTVDIHWVREERALGVWKGLTEATVSKNKTNEINAYQSVDEVWVVTEEDRQVVQQAIPDISSAIVSNIHEPVLTTYKDSENNNLLFLGNYNHHPNISAIHFIAKEIFPKVRATIPDATLIVAGANAPKEVQDLAQLEGIIFKGYIPEDALERLYQDTFLAVTPVLSGAGIKGKIGEAIAYCTPVLTNAIGNEGIHLIHKKEGLIGEGEELIHLIVRALRRAFDFEKMTYAAQEKIAQLVGPKVVEKAMLDSLLPTINICIVTWNRLDLLKKCLDSILENTIYPNYHISVYSNGCKDGTQEFLSNFKKKHSNVSLFLKDKNEGFVKPNNEMMQANTMDVVLVNNDVEVTKGWLKGLYQSAYSQKEIGVVGSKILYPNGQLQEFGAVIYKDGTGVNMGKNDNPNLERYQQEKEVGYVSGCAMFIKRTTIERIGVFDEQFHPCYFEDSDYCYTAKSVGLTTVVTPKSIIYHHEGATAGTATNTGFKQYQIVNRQKFLAKHQQQLS